MDPMEIRRYREEDSIKTLIREAVEDIEPDFYSEDQQEHLEQVIPEMNAEFASSDKYIYYVAEEGDKILGTAGFQKESGTLAGIFVAPERKKSGLGSQLLDKIEEKASEEGVEKMESLASLEAVDFYRKNGYKSVEDRKQQIKGEKIRVKVMTKNLDPETDIRHAEHEDIEKIREVALGSWKDTYTGIFSEETIEEVIDDWYSAEDLREQVEDPVFYVAEAEGEIAGFVHVTLDGETAKLHRIYLKPEHQGKGIGSELYERAERDVRNQADAIELEVLAENSKGLGFYRKNGYEEVKREKVEIKGEEAVQIVLRKGVD